MFGETNKEALSLLGTLGRKAAVKENIFDPLAAKHYRRGRCLPPS